MEKLPQLKISCCGCKLMTGTKIIGWLCLIFYIIAIVPNILTLGEYVTISVSRKVFSRHKRTSGGILFFVIIQVIISFVLLLGVYKNKIKFIQAYLITNFTLLIVAFILLFDNHVNWSGFIRGFIAIYLAFHIYFFLVVHSYYRTIKDEGNASSV